MNTPICDFAAAYSQSGALRMHMPGHKGQPFLGFEPLDLTEFDGADELYDATGIIKESEENASKLFGSGRTLYSAEGSSLCIRAMLYLALLHAKANGLRPVIAAARNAHKVFMTAAALLDLEIEWLYPEENESLLTCTVSPARLEGFLAEKKPAAVYLTSPDYLGNTADIRALAEVCHSRGVLLLVDNAHGAYRHFLPVPCHPLDLGADLCCDSAHKTLPVLTGGAYLHLAKHAPAVFFEQAENALALFASTSPSYLILQSLDRANLYLSEGYPARLAKTCTRVKALREKLEAHGLSCVGDEPIKLTLTPKRFGYTGDALAELLIEENIFCEFHDPDNLVMMFTPEATAEDFARLERALLSVPRREPIPDVPPLPGRPERVCSPREAMLSPSVRLPARSCLGRVLSGANVGCPPAVPIVVCGERIDENALRCFEYYGTEACFVML